MLKTVIAKTRKDARECTVVQSFAASYHSQCCDSDYSLLCALDPRLDSFVKKKSRKEVFFNYLAPFNKI